MLLSAFIIWLKCVDRACANGNIPDNKSPFSLQSDRMTSYYNMKLILSNKSEFTKTNHLMILQYTLELTNLILLHFEN